MFILFYFDAGSVFELIFNELITPNIVLFGTKENRKKKVTLRAFASRLGYRLNIIPKLACN